MKPPLKIIGEDGNVFNLIGIAKRKFRELNNEEPDYGWDKKWVEFLDRVESSKSYDEALQVFMDYFDIE